MHSPRSIRAIVAKFHTIPSHHLTDLQFLQIAVGDFSYQHNLLRPTTHEVRHLHDVIFSINKMLSKDGKVGKVLRVGTGYGAKRTVTEFPGGNWSLASG